MLLYQESKTINCKYCGMNGVVKCGAYNGIIDAIRETFAADRAEPNDRETAR